MHLRTWLMWRVMLLTCVGLLATLGCVRAQVEPRDWYAPKTQLVPFLRRVHQDLVHRADLQGVSRVLYTVTWAATETSSIPVLFPILYQGDIRVEGTTPRASYYILEGRNACSTRSSLTVCQVVLYDDGGVRCGYTIAGWSEERCEWTVVRSWGL